MAPILEKDEVTGVASKSKDGPDSKENLWASILGEVQARGSTKLPSCKTVLVLGDNESGKTTLIAKLQGVEDPKKGSGLEYGYIDVRDEYRDDHTRLSVWVLDGDPAHSHLLRFALSEETYPHTLVMFTVAMTTPWGMLDQLQSWASVLQDHLDRLNLSADTVQEHKQIYARKWQDYIEPGDELEPGSPLRRTSRNLDDLDPSTGGIDGDPNNLMDGLPLGQGVLTRNLGLDVVVVVTKTDYMVTLEKDYDYRDEHFDFIQQWVRRFCLQYGAALFYTSVKEDKNCDLLYKYLMHRIYGFPFRTPALVVEKDAVLIPAGWDNMKKISILYENMQSMRPDDYYTDVIAKPVVRKPVARETEIQADEEQAFLNRQLQLLNQGSGAMGVCNVGGVGGAVGSAGGSLLKADVGGVAGGPGGQLRSPAGVQKTGDRRVSGGSPSVQSQLGSPKKIDGTKVGVPGSGEGVLANFFNSLLSKKTGSPIPKSADLQAGSGVGLSGGSSSLHHHHLLSTTSSPLSTPDKATAMAMRSDAAAELDRLTRAAKKTSSPTSSPLMSLNQNSNASGETHGNSSDC